MDSWWAAASNLNTIELFSLQITDQQQFQVVNGYKSTLKVREEEKNNAWQPQEQWQQAEMNFQKNNQSDFNFGGGFDHQFEQADAGAGKNDFGNFGDFGFEETKVPIEAQVTQKQDPAEFQKIKGVEIKATKQISDQSQKNEEDVQNEGYEDIVRPRIQSK